ncbi:MAG: hypothetical protein HY916_03655 [Desulfovibrio sp.]|nr:hypothetical protein [Desulfovibrio sp.]
MLWTSDETRRVFEDEFGPDFLDGMDAPEDIERLVDWLVEVWFGHMTGGGDYPPGSRLVFEAMEALTEKIDFVQLARAYRVRQLRGKPKIIYIVQRLSDGWIQGAYADRDDAFEVCDSPDCCVREVEYLAAFAGDLDLPIARPAQLPQESHFDYSIDSNAAQEPFDEYAHCGS